MHDSVIEKLASLLAEARVRRTALDRLTDSYPDLDLAAAYRVQDRQRREAGPVAGWKLGVTSRSKQAQVGISEPTYGFLGAADALDLGAPLVTDELIQPRAEPEIVFTLGQDLVGPHVTAAQVLAASSAVAVGVEVLDSRYRDYNFTVADVVADNSSAGRYIIGPPVSPAAIDLRLVGVVLQHNGEVVATASGAAALGHPAAAVAWLCRALHTNGEGLCAGQVILSGGLTAAVPLRQGDSVVVTIDRLGTIELACR
ncbi:fumarylacetoacetate hydrolase family protein [Mycobacterium marseillense]|uniref:2-keto-4-pentenoate hydratase n=1 Tax=Mycobacterium marseillense TaxID=701042 RepID=UPI0025933563|nr:fumarylacetoacetate hydrolase family protein [Mycobacterium marseillense]MDM3975305.1 fumarylacetoacetate hydrolase family protein [Mycobacterium marseillense]